ncbi:MAG: cytochrome c [Alphaproteobacteria bacterium]
MHRQGAIAALSLAMLLSTGAMADELLGDAMAGLQLANEVCATCHMVAPGREPKTDVDAPAFPDLADTPEVTALSLRVFLQTPHQRMPDLRLTPDETDDVIAYILSLKK